MTAHPAETNLFPPGGPSTNYTQKCFYPNCRRPVIEYPDSYVTWDVYIPLQTIYDMFPPVVKLAIQENSDTNKELPKAMTIYIHPECAAEWGMHLIKDGLEAEAETGRKLRHYSEPEKVEYEF